MREQVVYKQNKGLDKQYRGLEQIVMNDQTTIGDPQPAEVVDAIIRRRETRKVLAVGSSQPQLDSASIQLLDERVKASIAVSGWAPFHYERRLDDVAEPWRYTLLLHPACRQLSAEFEEIFDDIKPGNKLPRMLRACGALVLVTWIPESDTGNEKLIQVNEEHLAAAAAATQNLLLALEARGLGTYWSSGGVLGSPTCFERYGIRPESRLISAIFVHYPGLYAPEACEIISGKNREKRSDWDRWTQVIEK